MSLRTNDVVRSGTCISPLETLCVCVCVHALPPDDITVQYPVFWCLFEEAASCQRC